MTAMYENGDTRALGAGIRNRALVGYLVLLTAAAMISVGVLILGEFKEVAAKIIATTILIAVCGISAFPFLPLLQGGQGRALALTVLIVTTIATVTGTISVWLETSRAPYAHVLGVVCTGAVTLSHLRSLKRIQVRREHEWMQSLALVSVVLLAGMISAGIVLITKNEAFYRWCAVSVVVASLLTLVVHVLGMLRSSEGGPGEGEMGCEPVVHESLKLTREENGTYRDPFGVHYVVRLAERA